MWSWNSSIFTFLKMLLDFVPVVCSRLPHCKYKFDVLGYAGSLQLSFSFYWSLSPHDFLYLFNRSKALRIPQNLMIVNLAVSDLMMVLTLFPPMFVSVIHGEWYAGDHGMCIIYRVNFEHYPRSCRLQKRKQNLTFH